MIYAEDYVEYTSVFNKIYNLNVVFYDLLHITLFNIISHNFENALPINVIQNIGYNTVRI